jgi:hypothetical protein
MNKYTKNKRNYTAITLACFSAMTMQSLGQQISYEGFGYDNGALANQSGGTGFYTGSGTYGWAGNWSQDSGSTMNVANPGLTSPTSLPVLGGLAVSSTPELSTGSLASRNIVLPYLDTPGKSIYFSLLATPITQATRGSNRDIFALITGGTSFGLRMNSIFTGPNFGNSIDGLGSGGITLQNPSATNPYLFVGEIIQNADVANGATANFTFNILTPTNPDLPVDSVTNPYYTFLTQTSDVVSYATPTVDDKLVFGLNTFAMDEFRFGTSIGDVAPTGTQPVPEPATLAVLALGAFGALRKRRK